MATPETSKKKTRLRKNHMELTILLADDHRLVREALAELLKKLTRKVNVIEADNFSDSEKVIQQTHFDLVILDMVMPGMQGATGISILRERYPHLPIVMLSGFAQPRHVIQAMNLGANGFLSKTADRRTFIKALKKILAGERYIQASVLSSLNDSAINVKKWRAISLTPRQQTVLQTMLTGRSAREIGEQLQIRETTVKSHLNQIFKKLGVSNRMEAIISLLQ